MDEFQWRATRAGESRCLARSTYLHWIDHDSCGLAVPDKRNHLDERLDEALEESFPASDPPAVHAIEDPPEEHKQLDSGQREGGLKKESGDDNERTL